MSNRPVDSQQIASEACRKLPIFCVSRPAKPGAVAELAEKITEGVTEMLPAAEIISRCREISGFSHEVIGRSNKNAAIDFYKIGTGRHPVLFYGFPDPGEAIGATVILSLMQALSDPASILHQLDVTWLFIPCLNFDDQPDNGNSLRRVMKTAANQKQLKTAATHCAKNSCRQQLSRRNYQKHGFQQQGKRTHHGF